MTYVALHRYLAPQRLALLLQSIFKTIAGQGFVFFVCPGVPVKVVQAEDLSALKPFPGAKIVPPLWCWTRKPTTYPVPIHWQPRPGFSRPDGSL